MKILSNKKYNDLISKQFRGIFADVNDDNLLRENGLLYGENKELQKEIERLNNIINELEKYCIEEIEYYSKKIKSQYITDNTRGQYEGEKVCFEDILGRLQELKGSDSNGQ